MDDCPQKSYGGYPWQATLPSIYRHLKEEFEIANASSAQCNQVAAKKLTTEALLTICFIQIFVILTLIRSLMSGYEYFKVSGTETRSSAVERKAKSKNGKNARTEEAKKSFESSSSTDFLKKILDCFCVKSNAKRIFSTVSSEEQLCSLHGIRSVTVIWVLVGHISMFYINAIKAPGKLMYILELQATQLINNTILKVDTFLVLSGFLNGYLFSQQYEEKKGKISWFQFYVYRFVRLSPMYFIAMGFYSTLFTYLGSGSVWPTYNTNPVCRDNWLWHVLYMNNLNPHTKQCITTTWYLGCEMQLYMISPIFLILLIRRPKIGYFLSFLGIAASCFANFIVTRDYALVDGPTRISEHFTTDFLDFQTRIWYYFDVLYSKPYSRLGTFLIGIVLGCYLFQKRSIRAEKSNRVLLSFGWIMSVIFFWISMFALYGREESTIESAVYNGLKNLLFSCSVAWIIFACVTGQGGLVNRFLSNKIFLVISRLSFTIYVTHIIFLEGYFLSRRELIDHSALSVIFHVSLVFVMIAIGLVVSLVFEAPILRISALFFRKTNQEVKTHKQE